MKRLVLFTLAGGLAVSAASVASDQPLATNLESAHEAVHTLHGGRNRFKKSVDMPTHGGRHGPAKHQSKHAASTAADSTEPDSKTAPHSDSHRQKHKYNKPPASRRLLQKLHSRMEANRLDNVLEGVGFEPEASFKAKMDDLNKYEDGSVVVISKAESFPDVAVDEADPTTYDMEWQMEDYDIEPMTLPLIKPGDLDRDFNYPSHVSSDYWWMEKEYSDGPLVVMSRSDPFESGFILPSDPSDSASTDDDVYVEWTTPSGNTVEVLGTSDQVVHVIMLLEGMGKSTRSNASKVKVMTTQEELEGHLMETAFELSALAEHVRKSVGVLRELVLMQCLLWVGFGVLLILTALGVAHAHQAMTHGEEEDEGSLEVHVEGETAKTPAQDAPGKARPTTTWFGRMFWFPWKVGASKKRAQLLEPLIEADTHEATTIHLAQAPPASTQ